MLLKPKSPCLVHPEINVCGGEENTRLVTVDITSGTAWKELFWDLWAVGS